MCLGVPGRVEQLSDDIPLPMGTVAFGPIRKEICLAYVPEVAVGDWVLVHAGFAIQQLDAEEADRTLQALEQLTEEAPG